MEAKLEQTSTKIRPLVAGALGGGIAGIVVQPFDVIKTRQQQFLGKNTVYQATTATAKKIINEESIAGLWKGTSPTLVRIVPGGALYFFFIFHLTHATKTIKNNNLSGTDTFLIGALSRTLCTAILHPVSVVKTRFEGLGTASQYKGTAHALFHIAKHEGIRGLFSGFITTVLRDAPYSGISYLVYDQSKTKLKAAISAPDPVINLLAAGFGGVVATLITHPQDVLKTRLQISPVHNSSQFWRSFPLIKEMYHQEGVAGFYKGLVPRLLRRPLFAAISWVVYEEVVALSIWHNLNK